MSEFNFSVNGGDSIRLKTAGKYCDRDIVVTAVDNGFYIAWDGNTEGRPFIDLSFLVGTADLTAATMHKVSKAVISADRLLGATYGVMASADENGPFTLYDEQEVVQGDIVKQDGWSGVFGSTWPWIIAGKAGNYNYNGISVTIPEDGTYAISLAATGLWAYVGYFYNTEAS